MLSATLYSNPLNRNSEDRLLDVLFKADSKQFDFPIDLILIVDRSGSMENSIEQVKETLLVIHRFITSDKCNRPVNLNLITFADEAEINYPNGELSFIDAVNGIYASGMTNMSDALMLTRSIVEKSPNTYKAIIMLSDGMPNKGTYQTINQLTHLSSTIDALCQVGATKISIGYGHEYNPKLLSIFGDFSYARNMSDVKEIIPCAIGRVFTTYGYSGTFDVDFPYKRVVIGEMTVGSVFNDQVYHLGFAVNPDEIGDNVNINFSYTNVVDGSSMVLTTKQIIKEDTIPPNVMGMYHEAACVRLLDCYQHKFKKRIITRDEIILIQERILNWHDSPTREACLKRVEDMMNQRTNDYETAEMLCVSSKQRTVKLGNEGRGYALPSQQAFFTTFSDMY